MLPQIYSAEYTTRLLQAEIHFNRLFAFPAKANTDNHLHSYLELHYNTEGSTLFLLDFHEKIELMPGEWILLGKNVYHEERMEAPCSGYCLGIEIHAAESGSPFLAMQKISYYKKEDDPVVGELLRTIFAEAAGQKVGYEDCCRNMLTLLLIHLLRCCQDKPKDQTSHGISQDNYFIIIDAFFNRVFHFEGRDLTINDLAEELHVSRRHVNRLLREHYGMTFNEMLLSTKIRFTEYLLTHTDKSVAEISEICGLTDTYLIRSFKKVYQTTPAQYRKSYKMDMV